MAEVAEPLFISQISRCPVTLFSQTRSAFPLPLKSPAPTTCQPPPTVGRLSAYWGIPPTRIQIRCWPLVFSQTKPDWPIPRKSPTPAMCQLGSTVGRLMVPMGTARFISQIKRWPVTDCSQIRSAFLLLLKSLATPLPRASALASTETRLSTSGTRIPVQRSNPGLALSAPFDPLTTSRKLDDPSSGYSVGPIRPRGGAPLATRIWLIRAQMPAQTGELKLVPPNCAACPSRIKNTPVFGSASSATSGTNRPELEIPVEPCQ